MNLKNLLKVTLAFVVLVLFASSSFAQVTYYVNSVSGLDGYNGLSATVQGGGVGPKLTITNAISAASDGDIISVAGNPGVPYNIEPGTINLTKTLTFQFTNNPVIGASINVNDATGAPGTAGVDFSGAFSIASGKDFTITAGTVRGAANMTFAGTSQVTRTSNATTFDAAFAASANSISLVYGDADITVGPEWSSSNAVVNVNVNTTGVNALTLAGNRALSGILTTTGGVVKLEGNTLTISASAGTTHSNAANITSSSVTSGLIVFTGAGDVTWNGAGAIPSIQKSGTGAITIANATTINGSVTVDAVAGNVTLTSVTTITGAITHNGTTGTVALNQNTAAFTLGGGSGGPYNITNTSTGTISFAPAGARTVDIMGNVENSGAGLINFTNNAAADIRGNLTLSSSGLITLGTANARVRGNVVNLGTMTLTADPAAGLKGTITFANAAVGHIVNGNILNSKIVNVNINPTGGAASVDAVANITFGTGAHSIGGSVTNRAQILGARGINNVVNTNGGITNSGNINLGSTAQNLAVTGTVSNEAVSAFDATGGDNENGATYTNCGNIVFSNVAGTLTLGDVKTSSTGFTYDGTTSMGSVLAQTLSAALSVRNVENTSTGTNDNGMIDFNAASAGGITVDGNISVSGSAGTGDILFGAGTTNVTGGITNAKSIAGTVVAFNATANNVSITGALSVSNSGSVTFANTTGTLGFGDINISGGSATMANTSGTIGITNSLVVSGGTLTLGAAASTAAITVNANVLFTAGTINLGTGTRTLTMYGPTTEFKVGATWTAATGAGTTLIFNGSVPQSVNVSSGGTFVFPGGMTVNNLIVPANNAWTLSNGNLRVGGSVTFTKGQVNIGSNYLFILGNFANNVTTAESYVTGVNGFISMQNGGAQNLVTKTGAATFSNFEADNATNGVLIGANTGANETYTFTGAFSLTAGTVSAFTDADDADVIEIKNVANPPTIYRNAGLFAPASTPTFSSLVNVSYIGASKTFSNEVPAAQLNNLTVATTGTSTVTANVDFTVNGGVTVNAGQVLALDIRSMTMSSAAGSGASTITLNGNSDITANGGGKIVLSRTGGTVITGTASTGNDASANLLPAIDVTTAGNSLTGIRKLVDAAGGTTADLTVKANGSIAVAFTNETGLTGDAPENIEGDIETQASAVGITLNSPVRVAGVYKHNAGTIALGANDLRIDGAANTQDKNGIVTTTGGFIRLRSTGAASFTVATDATSIPNLEVNLNAAGDILQVLTNRLDISGILQHTKGTLQLGTAGVANNLRVTGNTYTVSDIAVASINSTGIGTLELQPAAGVLTWTLNDPGPANTPYSIARLTVNGGVTLAGTATGGLSVGTLFTHTAGELNFGARNITVTGNYDRNGGSYAATTGYLIWSSAGTFNEGDGFSIPNFRVSAALNPADDKDMVVSKALDLNNAVFTHGVATVAKLKVGVADGTVPTITVTNGGNLDMAPVFSQGNANYSFTGAATVTVNDNAYYWPNTASLAKDVTMNLTGAAQLVFAKARQINGNVTLTDGLLNVDDPITLTIASGSTITRSELASVDLNFDADATSGTISAPSVNLVYALSAVGGGAVGNTGAEYSSPTVVNNLTINNDVTLNSARTVAGLVSINADTDVNQNTVANGDIIMATGTTLTIAATKSLTAKDSVTMNGTATTAGAGTLVFGGAADQSFAMGQATTVVNLTIDQTADAKVIVSGGNLTVSSSLVLNRGILELAGGKTLTLSGAGQGFTRGGAAKSHVVGNVTKAIPAAAGRYEFPVGSVDQYRPAAFTFATAPIFGFNLTVNHVAATPGGNVGLPLQDGAITINSYPEFYWYISSNANLGSAVNFNLELTGTGYTLPTGQTVPELRIIRRVDGSAETNQWSLQGGSYDNYLVGTDPTVTNINSQGGINPAGARFTYGLVGGGNQQVAGTVKYDNAAGTNMQGVTVTLTPATGTAVITTTNAQGAFTFNNVANGTYTVAVSSTAAWLGASAVDALLVANHYAGKALLTGLKLVGADVNNSSTVNNTDALLILKKAANASVVFAKGNWVFTSQAVTVNNANVLNVNLKGLSTGDMNANGMGALAKSSVQVKSDETIKLSKKNVISLPVKAVNAMNVGAMQLVFKYPAELVTFDGVSSKAADIVSYDDKEGKVVLAWADLSAKEGLNMKAGEALVTLKFKSNEELKAGSQINVELNGAASEIANIEGEVYANASLSVAGLEVTKPTEFALSNNYPNPFNPATTIKYALPVDARVSLVVFNTLGEEVATLVNSNQAVGEYEVSFNASHLTSGVYFYRLTVNAGEQNFTQTHKMILMK